MSNLNMLATPPNPSLPRGSDSIAFDRENMVTPTVRTTTGGGNNAAVQSNHHPHMAGPSAAGGGVSNGRLSQATPLYHNRSHHHAQPTTPAKRNRTHHPTEDSTIFNTNRSKMVVSRNKSNNGSSVVNSTGYSSSASTSASRSGRPSSELAYQLQSLRLASSSMEAEGRPSVGGVSVNPLPPMGSHHHALSPQCTYPSSSAQSPTARFMDPSCGVPSGRSHQSLSIHRNFEAFEYCEYSQTDTELSTFVAKRILTEFRELKELGAGQFGHVVLCEEMNSGDYVAIKISHTLSGREQLQRARRERDIMNALRGFPHIVHLYNSWEEGKHPQMHLQMQFCSQGNVASLAHRRRGGGEAPFQRWSEMEVLSFMGQMAMALDATHSVHVAHVDFKPENVLIDECGAYILGDFGCSLTLDDVTGRPRDMPSNQSNAATTSSGASHGAAHVGHSSTALTYSQQFNDTHFSQQSHDEGDKRYIALDMMNEKRHYKAGDMFSLGISLYELMSNAPLPLQGESYEYLRNRTELNELVQAGYSEDLVQLVLRLMHRDPSQRPTAREVLEFHRLRVDHNGLSFNGTSARDLSAFLTQGTIAHDAFQYYQTCFEVAHYLMVAAMRDHRNVFPASAKRLCRGASLSVGTSIADGASPMRSALRASQGGVVNNEFVSTTFRTPTMKRTD